VGLCSVNNICMCWMSNKRHQAHACIPLRCLAEAILARLLHRKCTADLASHKMLCEKCLMRAAFQDAVLVLCQLLILFTDGTWHGCCAVLCCAVLCCAVLCCAVLCCAACSTYRPEPCCHHSHAPESQTHLMLAAVSVCALTQASCYSCPYFLYRIQALHQGCLLCLYNHMCGAGRRIGRVSG